MKERPILFSSPMVRAILAGTKTQTRRCIKPVGGDGGFVLLDQGGDGFWPYRSDDGESSFHTVRKGGEHYTNETPICCPYGQPGDRLWVRETFGHFERNDQLKPGDTIYYRSDAQCIELEPWRPSIHMPRWASRITLEVVGVRVERLQDISVADAMAEGVAETNANLCGLEPCMEWRYAFEDLWMKINGPGSWDANPFVWVVSFKNLSTEEPCHS